MALCGVTQAGKLWFRLPLQYAHCLLDLWFLLVGIFENIKSYIFSIGYLLGYISLDLTNLRYTAIVVESEDAYQTKNIIKLLGWLKGMGVKHISLYDVEGVLKKSKGVILRDANARLWEEASEKELVLNEKPLTLEFLSFSDGKEAVVKAANYLFAKNLKLNTFDDDYQKAAFTESDVSGALAAIGCGGPSPDLLLIYGPVRCHLGFPAWKMRYTEIVHMGQLKFMGYGSLVEVIQRFTMVRQNYGT